MIAIPLVLFAVINAVGACTGRNRSRARRAHVRVVRDHRRARASAWAWRWAGSCSRASASAHLAIASDYTPKNVPGPLDVLLNIVPQNPFRALSATARARRADGTSVIVPSNSHDPAGDLLRGPDRLRVREAWREGREPAHARARSNDTMIQVTRFVLEFTPLGTFGLIAGLVGAYGFEKLLPLGNFVIACSSRASCRSSSCTARCCSCTGSIR
jgi:hypothetical protein